MGVQEKCLLDSALRDQVQSESMQFSKLCLNMCLFSVVQVTLI